MLLDEAPQRSCGELGVGLVEDHQARRRLADGHHRLLGDHRAGGVVGRAEEDDLGLAQADGLHRGVGVHGVVGVAAGTDETGAGNPRDVGVHRVGGLERHDLALRAAEGLHELLDNLVGAVGRPQALGQRAHVAGQALPQRGEVAVRVAVEAELSDPSRQILHEGGRRRVRAFVGVEADRDVELWRAVGVQVREVGPGRQPFAQFEVTHLQNAPPPRGRDWAAPRPRRRRRRGGGPLGATPGCRR